MLNELWSSSGIVIVVTFRVMKRIMKNPLNLVQPYGCMKIKVKWFVPFDFSAMNMCRVLMFGALGLTIEVGMKHTKLGSRVLAPLSPKHTLMEFSFL
ncbi:unnamed protein product [Vicia faba]|uniref:Uncharacterized protein n=1 Tax=Vicia faba TaxID=3906 RepID=A0AAV0ZUS2_VICFA|nr:unnamed protein product [Vicia faba]